MMNYYGVGPSREVLTKVSEETTCGAINEAKTNPLDHRAGSRLIARSFSKERLDPGGGRGGHFGFVFTG
jgi:hypothetical protein